MSSNTETRGAWLWRKMAAIYGARFLDMWRDVDARDVQAMWTEGLRAADITREALMRGLSKLYHTKYPPTLPEFIALCAAEPAMYQQNALALTNEANRTPPEEARAQLAKIREMAGTALRERGAPAGGDVRWAYRVLQRATDGKPVTAQQLAFAREAIEAHARIHGSREPGSDDEAN